MFLFKVHCFFGAKNVINRAPAFFTARFVCRTTLANKNTGLPLKGNPVNIAVLLKIV